MLSWEFVLEALRFFTRQVAQVVDHVVMQVNVASHDQTHIIVVLNCRDWVPFESWIFLDSVFAKIILHEFFLILQRYYELILHPALYIFVRFASSFSIVSFVTRVFVHDRKIFARLLLNTCIIAALFESNDEVSSILGIIVTVDFNLLIQAF